MRKRPATENPVHFLQSIAERQCERAEEQLQSAAQTVSRLLQHLLQQLQHGHRARSGSHAATLMCSISNSHRRRRTQHSGGTGILQTHLQARPLGSLAQAPSQSDRGEAGTDNERILISEVRSSHLTAHIASYRVVRIADQHGARVYHCVLQ